MPNMDDEAFARLFSAQYAEFADDLPLWRRLARESGSPILEIGCGSGRVMRSLAQEGFDVTGIDSSPAMLRRAGQGLPHRMRSHMRLVEQDVRAMDLPDRYRLVLAPCNTLAGFTDADLASALARARAHLLPGGRLAFEVPCPASGGPPPDPAEPMAAFLEPESGNPVQVYARQETDADGRRAVVHWRYDELLPDGTVRSLSLVTPFHLRRLDDYDRLLAEAGFAAVSFFGGYSLEPPRPDSRLWVVVGRGPG